MKQNRCFGEKVTTPTWELMSCPTIHIKDFKQAQSLGEVFAKIYDRAKGLRIDRTKDDEIL